MKIQFKGLEKTLEGLNKEIKKIRQRSNSGLIKAALYIGAESQKLCPVVTGNLKNSRYVIGQSKGYGLKGAETIKGGKTNFKGKKSDEIEVNHKKAIDDSKDIVQASKDPLAIIGYSAAYATFVHENPRAGKTEGKSPSGKEYKPEKGSKRKVYSTVGQWKFLEQPLITEQKKVLKIIKNEAKIK